MCGRLHVHVYICLGFPQVASLYRLSMNGGIECNSEFIAFIICTLSYTCIIGCIDY